MKLDIPSLSQSQECTMKNANKTTRDMECNHIIQCVGVFMLLLPQPQARMILLARFP